jgi:hypothetical protein
MQSFLFRDAGDESEPLVISQESAGAIGHKIYPGALVLCGLLSAQEPAAAPSSAAAAAAAAVSALVPPGALALELGAGVCGLPSLLLARAGRHALATDVPAVLPRLAQNIAANAPGRRRRRAAEETEDTKAQRCPDPAGAQAPAAGDECGSCAVLPLSWGVDADVAALRDYLRDAARGAQQRASGLPDVIVGADVVYHEELIDPLLSTLRLLTDADADSGAPPVIVLSYVQRFKRAKRFLRLARKHFDVDAIATGDVVDYDVLTWALPLVAGARAARAARARGASSAEVAAAAAAAKVCVTPASADHASFLRTLVEAAEEARAAGAAGCAGAMGAAGAEAAQDSEAAGSASHHIDSDPEDEWENAAGFAQRLLSGLASSAAGGSDVGANSDTGDKRCVDGSTADGALRLAARAAARELGVALHGPLQSFVWVMRRRRHR